MKKICVFLLILIMLATLAACGGETVSLHCDGEGCDNMVEVKAESGSDPDESWIVFCDECAENVLED